MRTSAGARRPRAWGLTTVALAAVVPALLAAPAWARRQEATATPAAPRPERPTFEVRRTDAEIAIDGNLQEAPWQEAATFELAYETNPGDNVPAPVATEAWITYDSDNLYVAFKARDPRPAEIRARLTDRDRAFQDDFVGIVLDTFNDERRGFEFFVNPLGIQMDLMQNDVTGNEDDSWDALWSSAGRVTEEGYVVELAVPFSSLRFPRSEGAQTWGVDAVRIYPRDARRRIGLNPLGRGVNCYLCQAAKLRGFEGITPGRNLEFDPTVTGARRDERSNFPQGDVESGSVDSELGLTVRWGLTPNLTLNGAVNPDFSQVEADAAQLDVNNQFALFFPEKRPFFLEGADLFETRINAVYSRNIADPDWGLKLTGKEGQHAMGVVVAQDRITNFLLPGSQSSELTQLEEENTSSILRYRRDLGGSASSVGALFTSREGDEYHNRVAGFDALFRWRDTEAVRVEMLGSQTLYPAAIAEEFGHPAEEIEDWGLRAVYQHTDRDKMYYFLYQDMGEDFRADLGFIPQVDFRTANVSTERYWYNEGGRFTRITLAGQVTETRDHAGNRLRRFGEVWSWGNGPMQSFYNVGVGVGERYFDGQTFDANYVWFFGEARPTAVVYASLDGQIGDEVDFDNSQAGESVRLTPSFRFDVGQHLRLQLFHSYKRLDVDQGELFTANLSELRATWQFNARAFVRVVSQLLAVDRQVERYVLDPGEELDAETDELFNQLLFSYKLNPQTVLFLGYSDNHEGDQSIDLTQHDRTLFLKLGYALVL